MGDHVGSPLPWPPAMIRPPDDTTAQRIWAATLGRPYRGRRDDTAAQRIWATTLGRPYRGRRDDTTAQRIWAATLGRPSMADE